MRGCQPPGTGRCITAPGKVSGSRRFYVIIRGTAWTARYGGDGWDCADIPRAAGENPVGTLYINQRCAKLVKGDMRAVLETRFLRKPGQAEFSGRAQRSNRGRSSAQRPGLLRCARNDSPRAPIRSDRMLNARRSVLSDGVCRLLG
jgi:hypothetical protein